MSLQDFLSSLDGLVADASAAFEAATDAEALEEARVQYLGQKSGALRDIQKQMGSIAPEDRKTAGMQLNQSKTAIQDAFNGAKSRLGQGEEGGIDATFDPSLPGHRPKLGHVHPITQTIEHLME
ncbi:MAG: phenylalanine--tRNA ligase subunit alpha, partial [Rubripirellula sp.]|nr:phenylalanine--tRNA ligase subunit alpha [Rubripirellula sp.]